MPGQLDLSDAVMDSAALAATNQVVFLTVHMKMCSEDKADEASGKAKDAGKDAKVSHCIVVFLAMCWHASPIRIHTTLSLLLLRCRVL